MGIEGDDFCTFLPTFVATSGIISPAAHHSPPVYVMDFLLFFILLIVNILFGFGKRVTDSGIIRMNNGKNPNAGTKAVGDFWDGIST